MPFEGGEPFSKPGFARVDLLASPNETDDCAPVSVSIHDAHQKLGLRLIKISLTPLLGHEFSKVCAVPSTLRLVKNRNPLNWRMGGPKIGITKVHNILDEAFYFSLGI